ncbi:MAG: HDIG domain-containing metalloprotein [Candidatus Ranarchaeia archaeon]|jgi:uncharacterized protein
MNIRNHSTSVADIAVKIYQSIGKYSKTSKEEDIVFTGGLLHDIGRCKTHGVDHGMVGGRILRNEGFPVHARIAEVHVLGGITKDEAKNLNLPIQDFLPQTLIEKIVTYADKRVKGVRLVSIDEKWNPWFQRYGETELLRGGFERTLNIERELVKMGAEVP